MRDNILENWILKKIDEEYPLTKEKLNRYQLNKLNENIEYAKKSLFYREHLKGINKLENLSEITKIPFLETNDLIKNHNKMLCVSQEDITRIVTLETSGTTGDRKRIFFSKEDIELTIDFFHNGLSQFINKNDTTLIMMPSERIYSVGDLITKGIKRIGARTIKHGYLKNFKKAFQNLQNANSIIGAPVEVLALSRFAKKNNYKSNLSGILISSDNVYKELVKEIEDNFDCEVYNHFGITEAGLGGAVECKKHYAMHPREADLYFEIIDTKTNKPIKDGEWGELVFTTLTRKAMPIIRYKTGDKARFLENKCACSSVLKCIDFLDGRISEKDNKMNIIDIDKILLTIKDLIDYKITVTNKKIKVDVFLFEDSKITNDNLEEKLKKTLKNQNLEFEIDIKKTNEWSNIHLTKRKIFFE